MLQIVDMQNHHFSSYSHALFKKTEIAGSDTVHVDKTEPKNITKVQLETSHSLHAYHWAISRVARGLPREPVLPALISTQPSLNELQRQLYLIGKPTLLILVQEKL